MSERARVSPLTLTYLYTRAAPEGMPVGRINAGILAAAVKTERFGPTS